MLYTALTRPHLCVTNKSESVKQWQVQALAQVQAGQKQGARKGQAGVSAAGASQSPALPQQHTPTLSSRSNRSGVSSSSCSSTTLVLGTRDALKLASKLIYLPLRSTCRCHDDLLLQMQVGGSGWGRLGHGAGWGGL